jgi:multidrug efflux pump subunit AcrA (membrane-fusion protein)
MKKFFVPVIALSLLAGACTRQKTEVMTLALNRTDYIESIHASGTIKAVNAVNIMPPRIFAATTVFWAKPEGSIVEAGDTVCILESADLEQMLDNQKDNLKSLKADLVKLETQNELNRLMVEAQIKENAVRTNLNRRDSLKLEFAPEAQKKLIALQMEKSRIEELKLTRKLESQKKIQESEARALKSRIMQAENMLNTISEQFKLLTITSPAPGMLAASEMAGRIFVSFGPGDDMQQIGGYPKKGSMIFMEEIPIMSIPDLSAMQLVVEVQEVDYKRIEKDQMVRILVPSADNLITTGRVQVKSLASRNRYEGASKIKAYQVVVAIDSLHAKMEIGLTGQCEIIVTEVRDTITVPSVSIFEKDSLKVVYVAENKKFRAVPVEPGPTNSSMTIITKGLKGDETISLQEPPLKLIEK